MSARNLDLELSPHQFGDAGQLRIVKPIPEVNAARFQDCLSPPIRILLLGSASAVLSMARSGSPYPPSVPRRVGRRRRGVGAPEGIPVLSRARTLVAKSRDAGLPRCSWTLQVRVTEPGPSGLHIRLTSDAEILSTEKSAIPERSRHCRNLLRHKGLRVPRAAVRGFWSRIARIMLIIAELATCAS